MSVLPSSQVIIKAGVLKFVAFCLFGVLEQKLFQNTGTKMMHWRYHRCFYNHLNFPNRFFLKKKEQQLQTENFGVSTFIMT